MYRGFKASIQLLHQKQNMVQILIYLPL